MNNIDWSRTKRGIRPSASRTIRPSASRAIRPTRSKSQFGGIPYGMTPLRSGPLPPPIHPVFAGDRFGGTFGLGTVIPASETPTVKTHLDTDGGLIGWIKNLFAGEGMPIHPHDYPWVQSYNDYVKDFLIPENEYWSWYDLSKRSNYPAFGNDSFAFGNDSFAFGCYDPSFGGYDPSFGSDVADAVIAYRHIWDPYIMATIRAMNIGYQALVNVSNSPTKPASFSSAKLQELAQTYKDEADNLLKLWNQFAGLDAQTMTSESGAMIRAFQGAVKLAQNFWQNERESALHSAGNEPPQPSPQLQSDVQAKIDRSGVLSQSDFSLALASMLPDFSSIHIPKWIYYAAGGVVILLGFAAVKGALTAAKFTPVGAALL